MSLVEHPPPCQEGRPTLATRTLVFFLASSCSSFKRLSSSRRQPYLNGFGSAYSTQCPNPILPRGRFHCLTLCPSPFPFSLLILPAAATQELRHQTPPTSCMPWLHHQPHRTHVPPTNQSTQRHWFTQKKRPPILESHTLPVNGFTVIPGRTPPREDMFGPHTLCFPTHPLGVSHFPFRSETSSRAPPKHHSSHRSWRLLCQLPSKARLSCAAKTCCCVGLAGLCLVCAGPLLARKPEACS